MILCFTEKLSFLTHSRDTPFHFLRIPVAFHPSYVPSYIQLNAHWYSQALLRLNLRRRALRRRSTMHAHHGIEPPQELLPHIPNIAPIQIQHPRRDLPGIRRRHDRLRLRRLRSARMHRIRTRDDGVRRLLPDVAAQLLELDGLGRDLLTLLRRQAGRDVGLVLGDERHDGVALALVGELDELAAHQAARLRQQRDRLHLRAVRQRAQALLQQGDGAGGLAQRRGQRGLRDQGFFGGFVGGVGLDGAPGGFEREEVAQDRVGELDLPVIAVVLAVVALWVALPLAGSSAGALAACSSSGPAPRSRSKSVGVAAWSPSAGAAVGVAIGTGAVVYAGLDARGLQAWAGGGGAGIGAADGRDDAALVTGLTGGEGAAGQADLLVLAGGDVVDAVEGLDALAGDLGASAAGVTGDWEEASMDGQMCGVFI